MFRKYRDLFIEIGLSRCRSVETVENLARANDSLAANHHSVNPTQAVGQRQLLGLKELTCQAPPLRHASPLSGFE
jgi:hypothetical protein